MVYRCVRVGLKNLTPAFFSRRSQLKPPPFQPTLTAENHPPFRIYKHREIQ